MPEYCLDCGRILHQNEKEFCRPCVAESINRILEGAC